LGGNTSAGQTRDHFPNQRDRLRQVAHDDPSFDTQHVTSQPPKVPIPVGISSAAQTVLCAIHFHDQPKGRREEIGNGVADDDLATERNADLSAGELPPKRNFRLRRRTPVCRSARGEDVLASGGW
jgi:hypothetical protein